MVNITMPIKKRMSKPRRKAPVRRRAPRKARDVGDFASLSVTRSAVTTRLNQMNSLMNVQLSDFPRAVNVAEAYQHYRISKVTLRIKSPFDTYQNTGVAYQKPYFYYMIDKSGSIPSSVNLEALKNMGAKPRAMDEKAINVSWRPSVLEFTATNVAGGIGLPNKYKVSPWLTTAQTPLGAWTPSQVDHLGIYYGAYAAATGTPDPITYDVEIEVQFQFKKPLFTQSPGIDAPLAVPLVYAEANSSSDGIVGGPDGL